MSARMEISVHRQCQAPWEGHEGVTHASRLVFSLSYSKQRWPRMCGHRAQTLLAFSGLHSSVTNLSRNIDPVVAGPAGPLRRPCIGKIFTTLRCT